MSDFRVIVTGSRSYPCEDDVWEALAMAIAEHCDAGDTFTVVHGACPTGADAHAASWFRLPDGGSGVTFLEERYPAEWRLFGKAAGPRRNAEMVALGADLVLAFPLEGSRERSRGTWDCVDRARAAGIPVEIQTPSYRPRMTLWEVAEAMDAVDKEVRGE
ncbi:SLOG family protein [Nocardia otitidiscaviarum]|uniref:SLOG family protein n=1 Tax=Nocardia otitidiscaviarum TaxID=1823 RepID=UPI0006943C3E|nr:SLOG family protein [Nocardia otitidiscaviarum]